MLEIDLGGLKGFKYPLNTMIKQRLSRGGRAKLDPFRFDTKKRESL